MNFWVVESFHHTRHDRQGVRKLVGEVADIQLQDERGLTSPWVEMPHEHGIPLMFDYD